MPFYSIGTSPAYGKLYASSATSTGGTATFYLTNTGDGTGSALFTTIHAVLPIGSTNTASGVAVPTCAVKSISGDLKTLVINVITGKTLGVLGDTMGFAGDGTTVYVMVLGI